MVLGNIYRFPVKHEVNHSCSWWYFVLAVSALMYVELFAVLSSNWHQLCDVGCKF